MKHIAVRLIATGSNKTNNVLSYIRSFKQQSMSKGVDKTRCIVLFISLVLLLSSSLLIFHDQTDVYAANQRINSNNGGCAWYNVRSGDTLSYIARAYHTTSGFLARINHIANINIIFVGQNICIIGRAHAQLSRTRSGLLPNGIVRWYAYNALDRATKGQVSNLLRRSAARHGLSARLLLAIAWQESGWTQHVIARDGGIGTMQIMPYTAMGLNAQTHSRRDPYKLVDNVELGATYLNSLQRGFHGNLVSMISAYNEGGWNVVHRGIFNWHYVNNVLALMNRF